MLPLQELLGLRFEEIEDPQVWNKDIQMVCIFTLIVRTILLYFSSQIFLFYVRFSVKKLLIFSLYFVQTVQCPRCSIIRNYRIFLLRLISKRREVWSRGLLWTSGE